MYLSCKAHVIYRAHWTFSPSKYQCATQGRKRLLHNTFNRPSQSKLESRVLIHKFERAMEDLNEFIELLRQIMSRECNPILSEEEIDMSIREMEVFELVGEKYAVWLNEQDS